VLFVPFLLAGCGNGLRARVAHALPCPEDQSVVEAHEKDDGRTVWEGRGCGRRVAFPCPRLGLSRTVVCTQDLDEEDVPSRVE
jgi:hypothetical protein